MIHIPEQFELGPRHYDIMFVPISYLASKYPNEGEEWDNEDGFCDYQLAVIYIVDKGDLPPQHYRLAFWHEVGHAVLMDMGLLDHTEAMAETLGRSLAQMDKTRKGKAFSSS